MADCSPTAAVLSCLLVATGMAATVLLLMKPSWSYFDRQLATR